MEPVLNSIDHAILDPVEHGLDSMGLMSGSAAPLKRALFGASLGAGVVFILKPDLFWNGTTLKNWKVLTNDPNDTYFPWWLAVATPAFILGVMI